MHVMVVVKGFQRLTGPLAGFKRRTLGEIGSMTVDEDGKSQPSRCGMIVLSPQIRKMGTGSSKHNWKDRPVIKISPVHCAPRETSDTRKLAAVFEMLDELS
ncbi:hypothetical protein NXS19_000973 [Fusarium pseudograminearum]|nr:hypothetical protein NXS19_000973 [Fusarium pseudograminearum]